MSIRAKASGIWSNVSQVYAKETGAWTECKTGWYKNSSGVWDQVFQNVQEYTLTATTNFVLETYLVSEGASTTAPIVVTVPSGVVIGSNDPDVPAFSTGDVSAYDNVLLVVSGSIQGGGGRAATVEWTAGGAGGAALQVESGLSIHITPTGTVYGGGGGGGHGGRGGWGQSTGDMVKHAWIREYDQYGFCVGTGDVRYGVYWSGVYKGCGFGSGLVPNDGYKYSTDGGDSVAAGSLYAVGRRLISNYDNGIGGDGGSGSGYNQARTDGIVGTNGTGGCGVGGTGGSGGAFGSAGVGGSSGTNGYKYALDGQLDVLSDYGSGGAAGGIAGAAISGASILCPYLNEGDVRGVVTITQLAPDW